MKTIWAASLLTEQRRLSEASPLGRPVNALRAPKQSGAAASLREGVEARPRHDQACSVLMLTAGEPDTPLG
ncbi:MAG: hypothetical protein H0V93_08865 [Euzebyales bacterium]|nr:hypothetical protein [Euzebyales bacterium]